MKIEHIDEYDYYEIEFADEDLLISEYVYIKDLMDVVCKKMQSESL